MRGGLVLLILVLATTAQAQVHLEYPRSGSMWPPKRGTDLSTVFVILRENHDMGFGSSELVLCADGKGYLIEVKPFAESSSDTVHLVYSQKAFVDLLRYMYRERFFELPERNAGLTIPHLGGADNLLLRSMDTSDCGTARITLEIGDQTKTITACRAPAEVPEWFERFFRKITAFADSTKAMR